MGTPLYDMLKDYAEKKPFPFHMPGHLLGRGLSDALKSAGALDITEIPGSDNLHHPEGVIAEAQALAARCFGAQETLFLVNGSTLGLHAMLNAAVKPGGKVLIGRDCHRSVLNALALLGAEPVFVKAQYDDEQFIPAGYDPQDVSSAFEAHSDIEAVLLTTPNYYGIVTPLVEIAAICHDRGIPLLVDEAHGAHFCFSDKLPQTAMEQGADACVQSLHKTLPALTQTALLHCGDHSLLPAERLKTHVSMLQTTSPSYVLMASIDLMRETMERKGKDLYEALHDQLTLFLKQLEKLDGIRAATAPMAGFYKEFSRLVLHLDFCTGYEAESYLRTQHRIVVEMADLKHLVLIMTPFHEEEDFTVLLEALWELQRICPGKYNGNRSLPVLPQEIPQRAMGLREALFAPTREVPVEETVGLICAEAVVPYPPGIPLIYPGERITQAVAAYVTGILNAGGAVYGIMKGRIKVVNL